MYSDHINQLYKAGLYAAEPDRVRWAGGRHYLFQGQHHTHILHRNGHGMECSCEYYQRARDLYHTCAHVIALEQILNGKPELVPIGGP